jgi:hypothetical protein
MRTSNSMRIIGGVAVAALLMAAQAQATIAWNMPIGLAGNDNYASAHGYASYDVGNEFKVNTAGYVNEVGVFNLNAQGFGSGSEVVAIFQLNGSTWSQVSGTLHTFSGPASANTYVNSEAMFTLTTPVKLNAGGTYAIVAGGGGTTANPYWNSTQPSPGTKTPTWNSVGGALSQLNTAAWYLGGSPDPNLTKWPGVSGVYTFPYGAGTFDFTPVPEVAAFGAAGVGLLGLVYIVRYARLRRTMKLA